jgi:hypothetical protein
MIKEEYMVKRGKGWHGCSAQHAMAQKNKIKKGTTTLGSMGAIFEDYCDCDARCQRCGKKKKPLYNRSPYSVRI